MIYSLSIVYMGKYEQCYFVHRYLNNAWYNKVHCLIGKPYLVIIPSNAHVFWQTACAYFHTWLIWEIYTRFKTEKIWLY